MSELIFKSNSTGGERSDDASKLWKKMWLEHNVNEVKTHAPHCAQ
jgi:hypothetical protein